MLCRLLKRFFVFVMLDVLSLLAGSLHAQSNQLVTVTYIAFERTSPVLDALYVKKPAFEG